MNYILCISKHFNDKMVYSNYLDVRLLYYSNPKFVFVSALVIIKRQKGHLIRAEKMSGCEALSI